MAIAREQFKVGQADGVDHIHVTFDSNVKAGSLLICCVSVFAALGTGRTYTVADGVNSWADIYDTNYASNDSGVLSYAMNAAAGATTVTVTCSSGIAYWTVVIIEVSGILTSGAKDQNNVADAAGANWDSGNITTTVNDEYLVGMLAVDNGDQALTQDGAWTLVFEDETGSERMPISVSQRIVSSTLTESYSGTIGASSDYLAAIASFKIATGGDYTVSVSDTSASVADNPTVSLPDALAKSLSDTVASVTDTPTLALDNLTTSVAEPAITVTDTPTVTVSATADQTVSVQDGTQVTDTPTVSLADDLVASVQDSASLTDTPTVSKEEVLPDLNVELLASNLFAWVQGVKVG